jgi:hypothetical protein
MLASFLRVTAIAAVAVTGLSACEPGRPAQKAPSTDYAKKSTVAGPAKGACLTTDEMQAVVNEIAWTQFYNAAIQCVGGTPALRTDYNAFRNKFRSDRELLQAHLQRAATKHRTNVGGFQTELANRDGASAGGNPQYCTTAMEGFRWALSGQVNNLNQVPPMMDFSSEMGLRACGAAAPPAAKPAAKK